MEGGDNTDKIQWTPEMLHIFCDICITTGWKFFITTFNERTGLSLTKKQLKNKWDGCKKDWKTWVKIISENGVGWSAELGTITATNEWWKAKIQECKSAKKFRLGGIEPALKLKFDKMYSSIVATGEYAWAPSSEVQYGGNSSQPDTNDAVDLEEGSGDSEEDRNPASDPDIAWLVEGVNISSSNNTRSSGKRKEMEANEGHTKKKKKTTIGVQLMSRWDQLVDNMSSKSDSTSFNMDKQGCSINEVMTEIHYIPGIRDDHDFHDYVVEIMLQRRRREMWHAMGTLEEKYDWLKRLFARTKKN
ncbi:L10-interacting MYB domain-containing protein [Salix suchowensis]|nr:L10-interacting MYB domain-containing protein [Salix suchowensis]